MFTFLGPTSGDCVPSLSEASRQYLVSFRYPRFGAFQYRRNPEDARLWFPILGSYHYGMYHGSFGGVIRDVLLNEEPVIFRKEIYAMACVLGGLVYWAFSYLGLSLYITVVASFLTVCIIRLLAVRYHISLPTLRDEEQNDRI